jgi:hypothetical protein
MCEPKRRHQNQTDPDVQMGFKAYLRFYEITQGSAKLKTYDDFAASNFYSAFVKFGRHCRGIRCVNFASYTDWLLKNNKKLDQWSKDDFYREWMQQYLRKESVDDAIERAFVEMQELADSDPKLENNFANYFTKVAQNKICWQISSGRISAWIVYNCETGINFLATLNEEQLTIIMPWIDPDFWQQKFKDYLADVEYVKSILQKAGL